MRDYIRKSSDFSHGGHTKRVDFLGVDWGGSLGGYKGFDPAGDISGRGVTSEDQILWGRGHSEGLVL